MCVCVTPFSCIDEKQMDIHLKHFEQEGFRVTKLGPTIYITVPLHRKCYAAVWAWLSLRQKGVKVCNKDIHSLIGKYIWATRRLWSGV